MCQNCHFANPLDTFICEVCSEPRDNDSKNDNDDSFGEKISNSTWFTTDALQIPFRPLIEMISSCEDQRGNRNGMNGITMPYSERDMFVDLSRSNNGQLSFAICVFFNFGRVVSLTTDKRWSQLIQDQWNEKKQAVYVRKKLSHSKKKKRRKKKSKTSTAAVSMYCQVSSWFEFKKYEQMSIGLINLTSLPQQNYVKYPIESKLWRPTLVDTMDYLEEKLIQCELNSYIIIVTKVKSGTVALMGWRKVEDFQYNRKGYQVVMELFIRDDGGNEEEEENDIENLMKLSQAKYD
jgi:hypothetical protein